MGQAETGRRRLFSLDRRSCSSTIPLAKEIALYYYEGDLDDQAPLPVAG